VADVAVAHEAVVEHFAARRGATIVPMKLFTMFTSAERALANLRARRPVLVAALRRLRGCHEWGVRAVRAPRRPSAAAPPAVSHDRCGAGFLSAKKRSGTTREPRDPGSQRWRVESAYDMLAPPRATAAGVLTFPSRAAAPPLLDAAFLVAATARARRTAAKRAPPPAARREWS
jgi:hypothetical protein